MKTSKKFGLGICVLLLFSLAISLVAVPSRQAFAAACPSGIACSFNSEPFTGTFTLQKGQITTTIASGTPQQTNLTFTFTGTSGSTETYTSTQKIFCSPADPIPSKPAPATITMGLPPYGQTISATLHAYWSNAAAPGNCSPSDKNKSILVINKDNSTPGGGGSGSGGTQGLPAVLSYNDQTYKLIQQGVPVYGLGTSLSPDCYGGSVIITNSSGTEGTAYVGLQYNTNGGLTYLAPILNKAGQLTTAINNEINGCGFPGSTTPTPYSGSIVNGVLNAPAPKQLSGGSGDSSSSCVDDRSLSWFICPVINGLSKSADGIDGFVESQLNFSVSDNLTGSVQRAWTIFRTLTTVILVIVMLLMVISQAVGGGPFDAYTVRKMLPKLVAAIILMQISWQLCEYAIRLSNDAGQAIGQLMAAPFGGPNSLELGALLQRWNEGGAIIVGAVLSYGGLITAIVAGGALLAWGWPVLLLAILLVFFAVLVALATLLVRNALIVLLVMAAPLAFIAFVLPGADRYWKMWKDNFIRVLVFFPLVIALVYAGRIFAWIVAGLGSAGPFDLIMILAGFFGPYFFLPKTFKWAGPGVAAAANAINNSWPVKRGREATQKGLMERQQRNLDQRAKSLDPSKDGYARVTRRWKGIPIGVKGNVPRTALENLAAGRLIPTKRGLAVAIQRGEKWSSEEDAIAAAKIKREQDKAASAVPGSKTEQAPYSYSLDENGNVQAKVSDNATARGKAALFIAAGRADEREAGVAAERALRTSSWVELGSNLVPIDNKNLQDKVRNSGAEYWMGDEGNPETKGKMFVRMYDLPRYNSKLNATEDLYPLPMGKFLLATPHITNPENKTIEQIQEAENRAAAAQNSTPRTIVPDNPNPAARGALLQSLQNTENDSARQQGREPIKFFEGNPQEATVEQIQAAENQVAKVTNRPARVFARPHHIQRAVSVIDGYMDAGNITGQSESEFKEFGRLAKQDPDVAVHFSELLHRIASGGQGGINVLTQLNSSASMQQTIKSILDQAPGRVRHDTLEGYLIEGKENIAGAPQRAEATAVPEPGERASQQQGPVQYVQAEPKQTTVQSGDGQLVIQHGTPRVVQLQPGEGVSPGGVILTRGAQEELSTQFESMRRELRDLKKMGVRSEQQQHRMEELQAAHPEWQNDDENEGNA